MAKRETFQATVEAIHSAGLDEALWPDALTHMARLLGGVGATLEVVEIPSNRVREIHAFQLPKPHEMEYIEQYAALSPRLAFGHTQQAGEVGWDYKMCSERGLARDPFYAEFLPRLGFRYFVSALLIRERDHLVATAVQRTPKQGHADRRDIALMRRLVPHLRQAFDVTQRLREADGRARAFANALDWLADGAALLSSDGRVIYVNAALRSAVDGGDGVHIVRGRLEFAAAGAIARCEKALAAALETRHGDPSSGATDFPVARPSGAPPFLVSVRPIPRSNRNAIETTAAAIVFVRDPLRGHETADELLGEVFGLTAAEADLARALQAGRSPADYARRQSLSVNTVYTHLRRIKEKTRTRRQTELVVKLNEIRPPAHSD